MKIRCPNCHKILGDTEHSIDCNLNCSGCRKTVHIKTIQLNYQADYLPRKENK